MDTLLHLARIGSRGKIKSPTAIVKPILLIALLAVLLAPFCLLYFTRTQTVVYGYDPLGYLYAGQRLAQGGGLSFPDANNALAGSYFAPFAFNMVHPGDTNLYFNYPPGLPLLLALAQKITHAANAPFFVTPFAGLAGGLATFWLGKQLFGKVIGLLAAILLGLTRSTSPSQPISGPMSPRPRAS